MSKVTSKLQVTIPKAIADRYGIEPGDEIHFRPAGTEIRVVPPRVERKRLSVEERLRLFDQTTAQIRERWREFSPQEPPAERGWTREELYTRGTPPRPLGEPPAPKESDEDPG